jgi:hypothetical protein
MSFYIVKSKRNLKVLLFSVLEIIPNEYNIPELQIYEKVSTASKGLRTLTISVSSNRSLSNKENAKTQF